ncbi:MAG TPA: hypothetical protein VFQ92_00345 [Blastocatellia bacterium]|nr:hypothetical protein [Blastocatellia bacterium]
MYFIAGLLGVAAGFIFWYLFSILIGRSITWTETRHPQLAGSMRVRVGEVVACSIAFVGAFLVAFWVIRLLTENIK